MNMDIFLPKVSPPPRPTKPQPGESEVATMLARLHEAGMKEAELVPGVGFVISSCGMLIGFDRASEIQHRLSELKRDNQSRSYMFPIDWFVATPAAAADIKVYVPPMNAEWDALIREALNEWNNAGPGSGVHLRFVQQPAEADTVVTLYSLDDRKLGHAEIPRDGVIGVELYINVFYASDYPASIYKNTIVHEMGHALGLAHSGGEDNIFEPPDRHIPGTSPDIDEKAVMASTVHPWYGWSADELIAIAYLFPKQPAE
ncbi:hypothetical protein [Pseudomonas sp. dw_358]|uniref:hypothetical protein n=1 Tax=Pseudomonas sp. dw_358 TaxID=2720083 RepID=UPI001BD2FB16|nr:hypothetical protein [Pseudomonas sp. dw_358]